MYSLKDFGVTKEVGLMANGSKVFLYRKPKMPLSTLVLFDAGSRYDPKGKDGVAHFAEHVLFKGTEKFKDETQVGLFLENIGGQANAFTWIDCLGISADVGMVEDYPKVVDFLYELIKKALFDKDGIEVERGTILGEIADCESNPGSYIYDLVQKQLFQETEIGRSIAGTKDTVNTITRTDLYKFYKDKISNGKMTVIVAGDIEMSRLLALFNEKFGTKVLTHDERDKHQLKVVRDGFISIKDYKDTNHVHLGFSFRTCTHKDKDADVLSVIKTIAGDGVSSSLFRKLRIENGLVYFIGVGDDEFSDGGYFSVVTSTSKAKVQKVIDILVDEFKRYSSGKVTAKELQLAKNKIIKSKVRQMQQSGSWVEFHFLGDYFNPEDNEDLASWLNIIEKISLKDITEVSKKYFTDTKWYLSMCGDIKEKDIKVNY